MGPILQERDTEKVRNDIKHKKEAWSENYVQIIEGKEKVRTGWYWKPFALFLCMVQFCTYR